VGHSILVIAWHLLTNDCDYADLGGDYSSAATPTEPASGPSPSSRPSATTSPSNPPPNTRGFSFQESRAPGRSLTVRPGSSLLPTSTAC
jgi:hypothetical protein